jgi:hypothetical protein
MKKKKALDERKDNHYSNDYGILKFQVIKFWGSVITVGSESLIHYLEM